MDTVGLRELKRDTSEILRRVRDEGESFDVTYRGKVVARLMPVVGVADETQEEAAMLDQLFAELDEMAEEIGQIWPEGLSAADAIREDRGRLG